MTRIVKALKRVFAREEETEYERFCRERRERAPKRCLNEGAHKLNNY